MSSLDSEKELFPGFEDLDDEEREILIIDWILADDGGPRHAWYITGKVNKVFYEILLSSYTDIYEAWNEVLEIQKPDGAPVYPHRLAIYMEMGVIRLSLEYTSDISNNVIRDSYVEIDVDKDPDLLYYIVDSLYHSEGDMYTEVNDGEGGVKLYYAY